MELAGGVLRWPEEQFWNSTPHYLYAALDGFAETRGIKKKSKDADLRDLMEAAPYRVTSLRGDPKAVAIGRRKR